VSSRFQSFASSHALKAPIAGNFDFNQQPSLSQSLDYAAVTGGMNNQLAAQFAQLQQLQLMQVTLAQQQSPAQMLDMQAQLMASVNGPPGLVGNTPPRFLAQQQNQDMGNMMAEQMVIQQQLEMLRAQQDALMNRFAEMQVASPASAATSPATGTAASSFANAARSSANAGGHRRYQSQQVASSPNMASGMSAFAGVPPAMGQFSQPGGFTYSQQQQQAQQQANMPKGHGRRHSVNVMGKTGAASAASPPLQSAPLPAMGMAMSPSMDFGASDLDFGASPTLGSAIGSPAGNTGWVPGHRSRESRSSISSLSGWGTSALASFLSDSRLMLAAAPQTRANT
jgi:protein SSD1